MSPNAALSNSRQRTGRFDQMPPGGRRCIVAQLEAAGVGVDVKDRIHIVSQANSLHVAEAPDEQSGSHQQHDRRGTACRRSNPVRARERR